MTNIETTTPAIERPFLTKKLLAQRYEVCERTIQNWSNAGLLVFLKRRRVVRYYVPGCDASLIQQGAWSPAMHPGNPQPRVQDLEIMAAPAWAPAKLNAHGQDQP